LKGRNQSLDVLRCIAVLLVLGCHLPYYRLWARAGWIGVDLFFVLSGFLISGLLFEDYKAHGQIDWKRFLIRRGFKIWPPFYVFLCLTALLMHGAMPLQGFLACAAFLQNYLTKSPIVASGVFVHLWSLAVEEHFYLLLPALLVLLATRKVRDPFRAVPYIFAGLAAICLVLRVLTVRAGGQVWMTHLRIDSLFAGVTLGYFYSFRQEVFRKLTGHSALVFGVVFCSPALFLEGGSEFMKTVGLTGLLLGFSLIVAWAVDRRPRSSLGMAISKRAASLGFYSYSIYLWHTYSVATFYPTRSVFSFWLGIGFALMLGYAMALLIELPFLRLRQRLFPAVRGQEVMQPQRPEAAVVGGLLGGANV